MSSRSILTVAHDPRLPCEDKQRGPCTFCLVSRAEVGKRKRAGATVPFSDWVQTHSSRAARDGRGPNFNPYTLEQDLLKRVVAVKALKRSLLVVASGLGLLALAVLIVLTNAVALVITLTIVGTIIFLLFRWGLAEGRRTRVGG